jgi:glycosyltransferase involved in cell wall biosynthesis
MPDVVTTVVSTSIAEKRQATARTLRVLHVISGRLLGGGQFVARDLVRALGRREDVDSQLCVLGPEQDFYRDVPTVYLEYCGRYNRPWVVRRMAKTLERTLRESDVDVVHTHGWDAHVIGAIACAKRKIAHVAHTHDMQGWLVSTKLRHRVRRSWSNRILARSRAAFVSVSAAARDYECAALGRDPKSTRVLHNGVDVDRFDAPARAIDSNKGVSLVVGAASRLVPGKGIESLIRSIARAREAGINVKLRIAGEGKLRGECEALAASLGMTDHVTLLGHVADIPAFYRGLDAFVLASESEGLPCVLLEAMSARCPVVATTVGGIPELIRDEREGLLIPPRDDDALTGAIVRLGRDPPLRRELADSGRKRVEESFTLDAVAQSLAELYRQVAQTRGAPACAPHD